MTPTPIQLIASAIVTFTLIGVLYYTFINKDDYDGEL